MSYRYEDFKPYILSDEGQRDFIKCRDKSLALLEQSGAALMAKLTNFAPCVDNWKQTALVDRMLELGDLIEVPNTYSQAMQHRLFIRARH